MSANPTPFKLVRIPTLKTVADFRNHIAALGIDLPCEDAIIAGAGSPLASPIENVTVNGKRIGNRVAIQPMEGWDGTTSGGVTEEMVRRWKRFGESGAKLIFGGEAMAVRPDGRANPSNHHLRREQGRPGAASRNFDRRTSRTLWHKRRPRHWVPTHALRPLLPSRGQEALGTARRFPP